MYDGDDGALSDAAKRGNDLFFGGDRASGDHLECFHCHAGFNFSDHVHYRGKSVIEVKYHNTACTTSTARARIRNRIRVYST